jgi:hypothetical protein
MAIVTVGIDLAKNVFAMHGVNEAGKPELVRPEVPRGKLLELVAKLRLTNGALGVRLSSKSAAMNGASNNRL